VNSAAIAAAAPGAHIVQFYEDEQFVSGAVVAFFSEAFRNGDPAVMIARRRTYDAVIAHLAAADAFAAEAASRILYMNADTTLAEFMDGAMPDPVRFERCVSNLVGKIGVEDRTIWFYGEMVDVLCKTGRHAAAVQLEELWNVQLASHGFSVLCGYALEDFDGDLHADQFRAVCRQHTHVLPAEGFLNAPDDRARFEQVALLQQRARALGSTAVDRRPAAGRVAAVPPASTVYVIDDDVSVRRSMARLLASMDLRVETFASAETFLAEVDGRLPGCLIVDVQLVGMSGSELQSRLADAQSPMRIIAMSAAHDEQIEKESLRLGASAFLRKPFDAQDLIDAIAAALAR
jgi:CheY-like chemotaxis protein